MLQMCSSFGRKTYNFFYKYFPTAYSPVISAKFVLEKYERGLEKYQIFHISVALIINFYKVRSSSDTTICRKVKL